MTVLLLFLEFFKIGCFSFGGGLGMLPLMEETVLAHGWLTEGQFYEFVGVCESTPGPIAVNMATYIGSTQAGLWGSLAATAGVVLPSFLIILLIAAVLKRFTERLWVKGFIQGVKPVVTGLILSTGVILLLGVLGVTGDAGLSLSALLILAVLAALDNVLRILRKKKLPSVGLILIAAALGIILSFLKY